MGRKKKTPQSGKECPSILPTRPVSQSISQGFPLGAAVPSKSLSRGMFLWYLPPADQRGERSAGKKFIIHTTQKITSGLLFLIPWDPCALSINHNFSRLLNLEKSCRWGSVCIGLRILPLFTSSFPPSSLVLLPYLSSGIISTSINHNHPAAWPSAFSPDTLVTKQRNKQIHRPRFWFWFWFWF